MGAFLTEYGIKPWEIGLLDVAEFDGLIDYLEEKRKG